MTTRSSTKDEFLKYCKSESYYLTDEQFSGKEQIKYNLDLSGLTKIPKGFNPVVVGFLSLSGLTSIPKGFNPIVVGDIRITYEFDYIKFINFKI